MILLEILQGERAIRATDLETHWTTYVAAEKNEFLMDELDGEIGGMITVTANRQSGGGNYKKRILAAFPKSCTIVIYS